jgi:hypothetical protein
MSYKRAYSYDDLDLFSREHVKIIAAIYEELNKGIIIKNKNIIHPTEQQYKKIFEDALNKITGTDRCLGTYVSGKHKNERCRAPPHSNSKYCLKHRSQDPENMQLLELKNKLENPENKQLYETDPQILREAIELFKKSKLNQDEET